MPSKAEVIDYSTDGSDHEHDAFRELRTIRQKNSASVIITHLNINSYRYKFMEIGEILYDKLVDICFFTETKLDNTYNQASFNVPDFKAFRNDRNNSGGGLIAYVRSNLPARRRTDLEFETPIESIVLDVVLNNRKWAILGTYRPPSVNNNIFSDIFTRGLDRISTQFDNILIAGDLNYDLSDKTKGATLLDLCDIFDLSSLVKSATCFMKNSVPSLVDVLLTNKPNYCCNVINFGCGTSDWHNDQGCHRQG
ncbi:MAG: hypothetical protein N0E48_03985 [Candidatus Thiodiazotropha endolucinida]|nr:hypothetical protein [Candidatus Thiodiazotropha endolucinida]